MSQKGSNMKEKEQVTIEELLEGPDMEESPLELLCLSDLTSMSSEEIKFQQLIKKLLEESKHIIKSIQQDQEEDN